MSNRDVLIETNHLVDEKRCASRIAGKSGTKNATASCGKML